MVFIKFMLKQESLMYTHNNYFMDVFLRACINGYVLNYLLFKLKVDVRV